MGISREEVGKVAKLARIQFTEAQLDKFSTQMDAIVKYVEQLNELDTEKVEPTAHALPIYNVMREDKVTNGEPSEQVFENAPHHEGHFFKVPQVIE